MAQNPHEYLIEQLQFTGDESVGSFQNKIKLNFNHPVKELVWVVQPDENVDYCSSLECGQPLYKLLGAQPFNYTDAVDALPNAIHSFGGLKMLSAETLNLSSVTDGLSKMLVPFRCPILQMDGCRLTLTPTLSGAVENSGVSDAGTFVLAETSLDMHCWGENPVVTAKLQLNGQDRFSEREGTYFDLVQPFQHHTRSPDTGINVYSFALRPEEHQPSGPATSPALTTPLFNLFSPTPLLRVPRLPRSVSMPLTTMFFVS